MIRAVMDEYGYVIDVMTDDEYNQKYGKLDDLYQPDYKSFDDYVAALIFKVFQNEYTRIRIQNEMK